MKKIFSLAKTKETETFISAAYYDYKAEAKPLNLFLYWLLLNPKVMAHCGFLSKSLEIWLPVYRAEKLLAISNYKIEKCDSAQCVHRIRLQPVTLQS